MKLAIFAGIAIIVAAAVYLLYFKSLIPVMQHDLPSDSLSRTTSPIGAAIMGTLYTLLFASPGLAIMALLIRMIFSDVLTATKIREPEGLKVLFGRGSHQLRQK